MITVGHGVRALFPGATRGVYLDTANLGLLASPVADRLRDTVAELTDLPAAGATDRYLSLEAHADRARREVGRLVGASAAAVALVESTSHALQIIAAALPLHAGDEVIVATWDFLGLRLVWRETAARRRLRLRLVSLDAATDPTAALLGALTSSTKVLCTSSVTEATGERLRVPELAQACRANGTWLALDVIQEAGVRPLALEAWGVDAAMAGGHKWLGCPLGAGFLFVHPDRRAEIEPAAAGYLTLHTPEQGWDRFLGSPDAASVEQLRVRQEACRLETGGTPNFLGRLALAESCALLNEVGIEAIARSALALTARVQHALAGSAWRVHTPADDDRRAGIVCLSLGDADRERAVASELARRSIHVSSRYNGTRGGVRAAFHLYNTADDADRLIAALRAMA